MSELEKFIQSNKGAFEEAEPPAGHRNRFEMRLERERTERRDRVLFWRVAAAIIVLVVAGATLLMPRFNGPGDVSYASMSLGEVSEDMADIEKYYSSELSAKYQNLTALSREDQNVKRLFEELERLNENYAELEKQLYRSGSNDRVILAMIENFRLRLEIMEKLEIIKNEQTNEQ
jgi:hypothetical protein